MTIRESLPTYGMPIKKNRSNAEHIQALQDFIGRVDRIENYAVPKLVEDGMVSSAVHLAIGESLKVEEVHPSAEEIDAFVNNLRFFMMSSEATSFENIAESIAALSLPRDVQKQFEFVRSELNRWLSFRSPLGIEGKPLTNERILRVFMFGDVTHINNQEKRAEYNKWAANPLFFPLLKTHFIIVMGQFMTFLRLAADTCRSTLQHLGR